MTQHNAAARLAQITPDGQTSAARVQAAPPNDNGDGQPLITPEIEAALRHFGTFGLGAAQAALDRAAATRDASEAAHWLGIAGMFDRQALTRFRRAKGD